jgi:hypothetical protein
MKDLLTYENMNHQELHVFGLSPVYSELMFFFLRGC